MARDKASAAQNPGAIVSLSDSHTEIFGETDLDRAYAFIISNISDTAVTLRLEADGDDINVGEGVVLQPGGVWREGDYAGPMTGRHNGSGGTKDISVVLI